jgi:site-specific DNA-cytosine methylase
MKKYALDLFSGSGNVTHELEKQGFIVFSCDWNTRYNAWFCGNILEFPFQKISEKISVIWASPDCSTFSREASPALWSKETLKYRQYRYTALTSRSMAALSYVAQTIKIIQYFKPALWIIENPVGRLRHLEIMGQFAPYRYCVNYRDWGFDYSKETDIYTNQLFALPTIKTVYPGQGVMSLNTSFQRSKVPPLLVDFLVNHSVFDNA